MNRKHIYYILEGLLVAIVWGYFRDLKNDDIYWFIGRLFFMPLFLVFWDIFVVEKRDRRTKY